MAPITIASLEEDDPERPDVGLEPNLDPRLGRLGQDAVLVLVKECDLFMLKQFQLTKL